MLTTRPFNYRSASYSFGTVPFNSFPMSESSTPVVQRPWRDIKLMVQNGFAGEWANVLKELKNLTEDAFDHRDLSLWNYIYQSLDSLNDAMDVDAIVDDYDPHPSLLHAMLCDIRLINYDLQFARHLESALASQDAAISASLHQTWRSGEPDKRLFEEWRNSYGLVTGRPVNAKGGLKSAPWLGYLYEHSLFSDEDYEKAFMDFGYHRARPVETLGRLQFLLCGLMGAKMIRGMEPRDERWKFLANTSSKYMWSKFAPL